MTATGRPLEETGQTQDRERRRTKRCAELLAYISRMKRGRLLVDVRNGTVATWRHLKDKTVTEASKGQGR